MSTLNVDGDEEGDSDYKLQQKCNLNRILSKRHECILRYSTSLYFGSDKTKTKK